MADVNANIGINIDSSNALAQLKALQRQISQFHTSIARSSEAAALAQKGLQKNLLNSINAIGAFSAEMRTVRTSAESFTNSLEKNKFSMREYFRYAGASTKTFGRLFKSEFDTIGKVAEERVKRLQTQYIKMGRDTNGAMKAMGIMPTQLNMSDYTTKVQIAAQKQALFNQLMKQGSTNLLNFGKNTQWAGRQLMVGFTLPLMAVGTAATKAFMDMEAQALRFRKVYGDLFTPKGETQRALEDITELGKQFTKYGVAVSTTVGLAAEAAAAGFQGLDLQRQTTEATRLSILGQVDSQKALETTISLQNAFGMSSDKLADSINFLNAVENQTVVSLDDITTAIPKVAPVIQQLGGDVKDLTFFIAAMKEGGINASEGANALKSGLAALINPTKKASAMLADFGINATAIVEKNKGNLKATVVEFATALNQLDPLSRARAIEQMFGKFQFARLSTLFANVAKDGNQAARVLDLANASVEELSALSEQELGMTAESSMNKFKKSVEDLKVALVPVGQAFLEAATPIIEFVGNTLEKFANLSSGTKKLITLLTVGIGAIGPVLLMTFGLLANGVANIIKLFLTLRGGYQRLTGQSQILGEQTQYMTMEQLDAAAAAHSLNQTHANLTQTFTAEVAQINKLIAAYTSAAGAARNFSMNNPGMMMPGRGARKLASGIVSVPGPKGAGDVVPAMLSPGESVIPADMTKKYAGLIQGMVADNIPGYENSNISFGGRNFSVSARGQVSIQRMIDEAKSLSSVIGNIDDLILNALINAENELTAKGKVRAKSLQDQLKTIAGGAIPLAKTTAAAQGGFRGNAGIVAAHGTPGRMLPASQAQELGRQLGSGAVASQLMNTSKDVKMLSNLTFPMPASFNKGQLTGRESAKFVGQNRSRFTSMIAKQNNLNPNDPGLLEFGKSIGQALKQVGNNVVSERDFENIIATGIENMLEGAAKTALIKSRDTFSTAQLSGVSGREGHGGIQRVALPASAAGQTINGLQLGGQSYRQQDISQNNIQADKFVIETIKKRTKNFGSSMVVAVEEGLRETLQAASPSRKMKKIGQDAGRGLILGAQEYVDDAKRVGQQLGGGMVQTASGLIIPGGAIGGGAKPTTPGIDINDIAAKARFNREALLATQAQKRTAAMNQRMNSLNKAFMSGTFALSALSGVASMAGGNLGKFSQILFQISGPMFALSSVIQLLTGEKIVNNFRKIGLLRFGAAAIAIGAFIVATKLITKAREEERRRLYAFGDALRTTEKQVKATGDYFGVTVKKSPLQTGAVVAATKSTPTLRNKINEFKASDEFKAEAETIKNLKVLSAAEAKTVLLLKTQALLAQGYSEESINVIISSLQEAAGKEKLNLIFKKIDIDALNKDILEGLQTKLTELSSVTKFEEIFAAVSQNTGKGASAVVRKQTVETKEYKAALDSASVGVKSFFDSLAIMQANNTISGTKLKESFGAMVNKIKTEIPDATTQMQLFNLVMKDMDTPLTKAATSTDNLQKKIKLLNAAMLGAVIPADVVNKFLNGFLFEQDVAEKIIDGILADAEKLQNKLEKIFSGGNTGGKKEVNVLQKMINEMTQQTKVFDILIKKRVEYKQALELSNNAEVRTFILGAKNNTQMKERIALIEKLTLATKDNAAAELKALPAVDKKLLELDYLKKQVDLREAIIDAQFAPQIKKENDALGIQEQKLEGINKQIEDVRTKQIQPIQNLIDSNNYALQVIALQEDAINEKYDKEIKNLDKIEKANQNIANIQKQRMSIADALTRGDISAAAQAVQDARAERAQSALTGQRDTLTRVRDESIAALGRVEIEKTNKVLQLEIATIEKNQLTTLELQKITIENTIAGHNANLKALNTQVDQLKNSYFYGNLTKLEIQSLEGLITKAKDAGILFTDELLKQATAAERIAAALAMKQAQGRSIEELTAGARDGTITPTSVTAAERATITSSIKQTIAKVNAKVAELKKITQRRMYGGAIMPQGRGGMGIVKSMAFGGRAIGSDSVPAMLTPGEFVMNKAASKAYGPLLERINESKYPGMLGGGGMTQIPVNNISTSMNDNSTAVYNYNLGFSINGANGSAKDIANAVMREIKNVDSQRIRGQRR